MSPSTEAPSNPPHDTETAINDTSELKDGAIKSQEQLQTKRSQVVLDLKRKALAAKKSDQLSEALQLLKQAKELEACPLEDLHNHPIFNLETDDKEQEQAPEQDLDCDSDLLQEAVSTGVAFTDDEMMNEEMMTEFALGGMEVPSDQAYQVAILKYKQAALQYKQQGDIPKATSNLKNAKQLQKVQVSLKNIRDGVGLRANEDIDGWMETLNEEDSALLGELLTSHENEDGLLGMEQPSKLDLQDLELMDDSDIKEYMRLGDDHGIPTASELLELASQAQKQALEYKQKGTIDMAKVSLVESKKYKMQAERIDRIMNSNDGDESKAVTEEDLEALMNDTKKEACAPKVAPPPNPWLQKPSGEIKQEVLRLKNENQIKEATELLKIYKVVAKKEADQVETDKCKKIIERIQRELDICNRQTRMFCFFGRCCEACNDHQKIGTEQRSLWNDYQIKCQRAIQTLQDKGSSGLKITLQQPNQDLLQILEEDLVGMIETGTKPGESTSVGLETMVLELIDIHKNKAFKKILAKQGKDEDHCLPIKVDVKFQLPAYASQAEHEAAQSSINLTFLPIADKEEPSAYTFPKSQHIPFPPKDSKQAKTILRRMETKKVQISVYYDHNEEKRKSKSSWFGWGNQSSNGDAGGEEQDKIFLGKVVLELSSLLSRKCLVGDFPLQINSKDVGGMVRLCIRSDQILDTNRFEGVTTGKIEMESYEKVLSFSPNSV